VPSRPSRCREPEEPHVTARCRPIESPARWPRARRPHCGHDVPIAAPIRLARHQGTMHWPKVRSSRQSSVSELATEPPAIPIQMPPSIGLTRSAGLHTESPGSATDILIRPSIVNLAGNGQAMARIGAIRAIHQNFSNDYTYCMLFCMIP
jgi:hypothetical protein